MLNGWNLKITWFEKEYDLPNLHFLDDSMLTFRDVYDMIACF